MCKYHVNPNTKCSMDRGRETKDIIRLQKYLVFFTIDTIKSLIISSINIPAGKNLRIKFLYNSLMFRISCPNELIISYI